MHLSSIAVTFSPKSRARAHSPYPRGEASSGSVSRAQSRAGSGGRRPAVTAFRLTRVVIACSFGTNSSRTSFGLPKGIEALLSKLFVARPRRDDDARLRGPAAAVDRLLDAVVADIGRPSQSPPFFIHRCYAGSVLTSTEHRGTADGKPVHIFLSEVSVKLTGSDTWMKAE
jgi:hypothetical protein